MKNALKPELFTLIFELRYAHGYLYLDRCGQVLLDIERKYPEWVQSEITPQGGTLFCAEKEYELQFSSRKYVFVVKKAGKHSIDAIAKDILNIWKIINANLLAEEIIRLGIRFYYLLPTKSTEAADKLLEKCKYNVILPEKWKNENFSMKTYNITTVLINNSHEYRVNICTVTRSEAIDPGKLFQGDPRALPRNQRQARIHQMKSLAEYRADPTYAVQLDVDCSMYDLTSIDIVDEVVQQYKYVRATFYPIIDKL